MIGDLLDYQTSLEGKILSNQTWQLGMEQSIASATFKQLSLHLGTPSRQHTEHSGTQVVSTNPLFYINKMHMNSSPLFRD